MQLVVHLVQVSEVLALHHLLVIELIQFHLALVLLLLHRHLSAMVHQLLLHDLITFLLHPHSLHVFLLHDSLLLSGMILLVVILIGLISLGVRLHGIGHHLFGFSGSLSLLFDIFLMTVLECFQLLFIALAVLLDHPCQTIDLVLERFNIPLVLTVQLSRLGVHSRFGLFQTWSSGRGRHWRHLLWLFPV